MALPISKPTLCFDDDFDTPAPARKANYIHQAGVQEETD